MTESAWVPPRARGEEAPALPTAAQGAWRRFLARRTSIVALTVLAMFLLVALGRGVLADPDPMRGGGPALLPPSAAHWFGTDNLGHDIRDLIVAGARPTLLVGFLSAAIATGVGTIVGGVSGFVGGVVDDVLMRVVEVVEIIPRFFLAILLAAVFGPSLTVIVLLLGLTFWPDTARLLRSEVLSVRQRDFVLAHRALGVPELVILCRHVLPNAYPVLVISGSLQVGAAVLTQAGLAFLGLVDTSTVSWGAMLQSAQPFITIAWWAAFFPGAAISLLVISTNLAADGLLAAYGMRRGGGRA
jgi:peptide/nickel transport system permease protein